MIELTDINGTRHLLHPNAISRVSEAGPSGQWHGIRSYVRTFDGQTLEVQQTVGEISGAICEARQRSASA